MNIKIRNSKEEDINFMIAMSYVKRKEYEKAQPQFWRSSGIDGDEAQKRWFKELLTHKEYLMYTAEDDDKNIIGFIIGRLMKAPEVYDPGGLTLMVDDFCVKRDNWDEIGSPLIDKIVQEAKSKGAAQVLVVCGAHDDAKRTFLKNKDLKVASEWFVKGI